LRLLIAAFVGLSTYLLVGLLKLEKIIPLSKIQIKMLASVTLFLLASVVL
jgi:hypothetical protein